MSDVLRTSTSVALMSQVGVEHGLTHTQVLAGTGLDTEDLYRSGAFVTRDQEVAVVRNLVDLLDDPPGLGLEVGLRYHLTTYGIWGFALISSPTLRSAIGVGLRFIDLTFALCRVRLHEDGDEGRLILAAPDVPKPLRRFVLERDAAALLIIQREIAGAPLPVRRVGLDGAFAALTEAEVTGYAELFGAPVDPRSTYTYAAFDRKLLDTPLPQADSRTTEEAQEQCQLLLSERRSRAGEAARARNAILARLHQGPAMAVIAGSSPG